MEQEGSQPPLYYLVTGLLTSWIDTDDLPAVRRLNPHATIGIPLARDNKNMVVHAAEPSGLGAARYWPSISCAFSPSFWALAPCGAPDGWP